ncbi:MAG: YifB family Mg chelatase-like AAA ATPase, partial [Desulfocapsaceae bacterium]|nr:YifB family Mg chelatase-like AAA ATPase [Desulfocapsaceae bacterium]
IEPFICECQTFLEGSGTIGEDLADVRGQEHAKRALEIAASGNHNVLLKGPPGSGKTMLAKRLTTILPPLSFSEAIESTKIHSIAGTLAEKDSLVTKRPFRAPHHTISDAGLIGGGSYPKPGEVSLATHGVLFLDELTEFKRRVLEMLRQPLEDGKVTIARANMTLSYPADFLLVGAYNPCPCGYFGDRNNRCTCTSVQVNNYTAKLSGPLLDRMDMHLEIHAVPFEEMEARKRGETSIDIRNRVINARKIQSDRFSKDNGVRTNGNMSSKMVEKYCQVDKHGRSLLETSVGRLGLSARAYHRILKIARTIADLDFSETIERQHLAEAIQYRRLG